MGDVKRPPWMAGACDVLGVELGAWRKDDDITWAVGDDDDTWQVVRWGTDDIDIFHVHGSWQSRVSVDDPSRIPHIIAAMCAAFAAFEGHLSATNEVTHG